MTLVTRHNSKKWLWLAMFVTVVIVLTVQIPLLLEPEYVDEDLRFFYWLFRFANPSLFEVDSLLGYQFAEVNLGFTTLLFNKVSLLYGTLYALLSPFFSPFIFSKILIFPLALIATYYLFQITSRLTTPFIAFLVSGVFTLIVAVPFSPIALSSGLPRSFTLPLLLAMLYYMDINNHLGMVVVLILGLFYPPLFLTILLTYGVKYILESWQRRQLALTGKQFVMFFAALLLSVLLLLPAIRTGLNTVPVESDKAQDTTVFSSPLFGNDGRYPLLKPQPISGNGGILDKGMIGFYSLIFMAALIPITLILRRQFTNLPSSFWYLALASLIGFVISWLAILFTSSATFHMPSRYMRGTIFLIGLILFIINGPLAIQVGSKALTSNRGKLDIVLLLTGAGGFIIVYLADVSRTLTAVVGLLIIAIAVLLFVNHKRFPPMSRQNNVSTIPENLKATAEGTSSQVLSILFTSFLVVPLLFYVQGPSSFIRPQPDTAELINFIKTLPQNTLISGYPCLLDDIPLYSQRSILFSCETESRDMEMMMTTLDAYFAETEAEVLAFCREYNVDYMVASPETFTEAFRNQEHIIFEPLNSFLKQQLEGRSSFILEQIPDNNKSFQNSTFFAFPCTADAFVLDAR